MGMDRKVRLGDVAAKWEAVRDLLAAHGFPVELRMIDGQLAFPDEEPPAEWRELRLGTPQGMVTVRREADAVVCVTWGNADETLRQAWNAVAWAFAEVCGGVVEVETGTENADRFRERAELPPTLRSTRI
jgi:hypothetical protein